MSGLNLHIEIERDCVLDGLVLYEPIDENLLDKCINCDLLKTGYTDKKWFENEKQQLENYKRKISRNLARVEYRRKEGYKIGRVNPVGSLGLHSLTRETRHTLVNGRMRDIDIECCHPVLLLQVLIHNNYKGSIKYIKDVVENRNKWTDIIAESYKLFDHSDVKKEPTHERKLQIVKKLSKTLIIRICYGGSVSEWKKDNFIKEGSMPECVKNLVEEVKGIFAFICDSNQDLYKLCKQKNIEKGKDYNHEGTTTSWFLQDKECLILETIYTYCCDNNLITDDICALCNDGIMIQEENYTPDLLQKFESHVLEQTGFKVRFTEKSLDEGYADILDKHIIFDLYRFDIVDANYAKYFKLLYHNQFIHHYGFTYSYNGFYWEKDEMKKNCCINDKIVNDFRTYVIKRTFGIRKKAVCDLNDYKEDKFMDANGVKKKTMDILKQLQQKYKINVDVNKYEDSGKIHAYIDGVCSVIDCYLKLVEKYLGNVSTRDRLVKDICREITCDWINMDQNEYLLGFLNGVYNLKTSSWIKPHYSQYISLTTGWKWVNSYSKKYKTELNKILSTIHTNEEVRKHYLIVLSTGLYGKVVPHFFVAKGVGRNGKSVLNGLMMKTVGTYGYKLASQAVSSSIKEGPNPTIANMDNKRFVLVQEPEKSKRVQTSTIKEITGDKAINCRTLWSTNTETRLKLTLVMECNDLPQLDETGDAIAGRINVTPFKSRFLLEHIYNDLTEEEKESGLCHLANPYYTGDEFQDLYKQALMEILMEHFKIFKQNNYIIKAPKEVIKEADEYMKYSDDFYGWFSNKFVKDENSIIEFKKVFQEFTFSKYYENMSKKDKRSFNQSKMKTQIMTNYFLKSHFQYGKSMYKGTQLKCDSICGYRLKGYSDDDSEDDEADDNSMDTIEF